MALSVQRLLGCVALPAGLTVIAGVSALALCHLDVPVPGGTDFTFLLQAETRSHYPEAMSFAFVPWAQGGTGAFCVQW